MKAQIEMDGTPEEVAAVVVILKSLLHVRPTLRTSSRTSSERHSAPPERWVPESHKKKRRRGKKLFRANLFWTPEEDGELESLRADGLTLKQMAKRLGRTPASIASRLEARTSHRHNMERSRVTVQRRRKKWSAPRRMASWTQEEEAFLRNLAEGVSKKNLKWVARQINRTPSGVWARSRKLKVWRSG